MPLCVPLAPAQALPGAEECAACHDAGRRSGKREAGAPPSFDSAALSASPHSSLDCGSCHADLSGVRKFPHKEKLAPVDCGSCHIGEQERYSQSLHGTARQRGDRMAPSCTQCHGTHNVLRRRDPNSPISTMGVPRLCGQCHRDGSEVSRTHDIPQTNILGDYTDSIHGEGLFRRGLIVTAVCTSCHTSHFVLPHTDPRSSIAKANIAKTCTQCHARIEDVHQKVIRGELWERQPNLIPSCVDCHQPHRARRASF
ncbi:MAG: cytochrome c3 family protein [Bryobacteraceae bacterium]